MLKFIKEKVGLFMDLFNTNTASSTYNQFAAGGKTLYEMLASGAYKNEIAQCVFPEITHVLDENGNDAIFMTNNRYYNYNDVQPRYQWFITFSENGKIASDLNPGYIELYPNYKILSIISTTPHSSSLFVDGLYDLNSRSYNTIYEVNGVTKPMHDGYGNPIEKPEGAETKLIPVSDKLTMEMSVIYNQIKNGTIKLSTSY